MSNGMDLTTGWRADLDIGGGRLAKVLRGRPQFAMRAGTDFEAPEEVDPRGKVKLENQGSMGSCQGHGLSTIVEWCEVIQTGQSVPLSRLWAYLETQRIDGLLGADQGSTISGGVELAQTVGICREELCPYPNPVQYPPRWKSTSEQREDAAKRKIRSATPIANYDQAFSFLAAGAGGISTGTKWGWTPNSQGVVEHYAPNNARNDDGHAVAFLGYSKRKDRRGRNYLWMPNSWGEMYGLGGWAEVAPDAVDQAFRQQPYYTVFVGLSDLTVPKVRSFPWGEKSVFMK